MPRTLRRRFPVVFRGRRLVVEVRPDAATYTLGADDEPLPIVHWGEDLTLRPVSRSAAGSRPRRSSTRPASRGAGAGARQAAAPDGRVAVI